MEKKKAKRCITLGEVTPLVEVAASPETASTVERYGALCLALVRVECNIKLSIFVRSVFRYTGGGIKGELVRSHEQLGWRPHGMHCSASTARKVVAEARRLGLVMVAQRHRANGARRANGYSIDWPGVHRLLADDSLSDRGYSTDWAEIRWLLANSADHWLLTNVTSDML